MSSAELKPGAQVGPYTIEALLGRGGQASTWRARDRDGSVVALKHFSLTNAEDWKAIELFEREAKVLEHIDHPSVPRFHQSFHEGPDCYIAQDLVDGRSLSELLEAGEVFDEERLKGLAEQVLEVLDWLHTRAPPVIHRDLKLSNLLMRDDGRLMLIDFGAVQRKLAQRPEGGSTVVGTHGYMAPEQLMGRAEPASDLYGFGATLLHLATGRHPGELPTQGLELDFRALSPLSDAMNDWLERMTASNPRERPMSAAAALTELKRPPAPPAPPMERIGATLRKVRQVAPKVAAGALLLLAIGTYLTKDLRERPAPQAPAPKTEVAEPASKVFVDLPVTLGAGSQGVAIEVRASKLRRAEAGFPRASYELRVALGNPTTQAITAWQGQAALKTYGKETQLRWMLVDGTHPPLLPGETRIVRLSEWDVPSNLESVDLRFAAPTFAEAKPRAEKAHDVPVSGLDKALGSLPRVPASEQLGRCHETRCFDFAFTLGETRQDWLKLQQNCEGSTQLTRGSHNDRIFQIGTKALRDPYTKPSDRFVFRVFCPRESTEVTWRVRND